WRPPKEPVIPWTRIFVFSSTRMAMRGERVEGRVQGSGGDGGDRLGGGIGQGVSRDEGHAGFRQGALAGFDVVPLQSDDQGNVQVDLLAGGDDALRDDVAVHDAAEDVH